MKEKKQKTENKTQSQKAMGTNKKTKEMKKKEKENNTAKPSKFHTYLWYFIIFSLIGLLIEFIVCLLIKNISKSEFGLILGPLCFVYGIGAILTIICLQKFKGQKVKLFFLGIILGGVIQYVMSFILEAVSGAQIWNCAWSKFNINGRVCIEYALIWGFAAILIVNVMKKGIDKIINKIYGKTRTVVDIILTIIIACTIMLTIWGVITYGVRARETLNGKNYISNNNIIEKFQNTVFSNEIMEKIFPKMKIFDNEGNWVLIKNING